jgi:hypothetical protein
VRAFAWLREGQFDANGRARVTKAMRFIALHARTADGGKPVVTNPLWDKSDDSSEPENEPVS